MKYNIKKLKRERRQERERKKREKEREKERERRQRDNLMLSSRTIAQLPVTGTVDYLSV